ncbi:transcriptional regulator [Schinkia azotoformans MEV2011]|uniref:Transcriptional regulator n=1 Tax=Schinkia azotoformans MEV2011 TaxID=1348973 RepID=A0A072NP73_SCHAZ|nr:MarR family transcriptional regulator [Schinkia azotoformans]KEF38693.1 transcriptional regulator [Schinkia azotoformans MEV2011]MEC1696882.1 MarR family transcriptional regulator [Schinkia azotoformans]MEC1717853.1 MarR family transcriptional regulator [Schinkia azotoformans]MEC1727221.1 MarR family transcriptional regulator [Schinkia azotoformans]MEC1739702.1 MarR family transcriptional regulator [Schinkia azotoformans]
MSKLFDSYGFLTGKIVQLFEEDFVNQLKQFELDARQYGVLVKVYERADMSQIQIAEELKIDRTTMAERAEQLESLNYITRVKNPQDRRTYCLNITNQGKGLLEKCWALLQQSENKILSPLSDDEKENFKNHLFKIYKTWRGNSNE